MARIGIIGSEGRMGKALAEAIVAAGESHAGGIDMGGEPLALAKASDVLVDFSSPHALEANLDAAAAAGRGIALGGNSVRGRDGITGARQAGTIGFASLRGGEIAGDHTVHFLSDHEHLSLRHHAENRMIFAQGAVKAAQWLLGKPAGRYRMAEVLGL